MKIKTDLYRAQQVRTMLSHETSGEPHYDARLTHWAEDSKPINVEADVLTLLAGAYEGEYIEVNEPDQKEGIAKYSYWCHYGYEEQEYVLLFVHLPHLNNRDVVNLLIKFDLLYADTDQDTTDWALEYQLLTRMLIHDKCLLVNPLYLDISEEEIIQVLTDDMSDEDRKAYMEARTLTQSEIFKMYKASER